MMPPFPSLRLPERWQIPVLAVAGVGALAATTMAAAAGFTAVIAQTFYIPIILAVVWYRWRGLAVVAAITAAYIPILGWFTGFASPAFPEAVARAAVMIAVALVLAALSSHVSALARDYPGIFQHAGDGYIIVDQRSLAVLDLNRTAAEMIGFAPSEVVGRSLVSLFADPATAEGTAEALKAGQDLDILEAALTMRGGGVRWVRIVSGSLPEDRVVCTLLDISRQKEDERTMRALARLAGESPDPVLRIGPGGQIFYANEAAMAVIGAEAPGEKSEARAALSRAAAEATATGDQVELEVQVGDRTFLITVVPIEGEDYVNLYGKDITGIKAAETAIRLNEQRLEALRGLDRMYDAPLKAITDYALSCAISMTGSEHGYFAFLDPEERTLTMQSWSDRAMAVCRVENPQNTYILSETGLWGEPVRQRHRVILNDYAAPSPLKKGTPPGHPAIRRFLSVPVFEGERIVAVAGVINKAAPYDEDDARQFSLLMTGMWGLVRRKRHSDDLKRSEALYRTIFEATGTAMMILDADGTIVHANARFRHFGYDPADIVGRSAWTSVFDGPMHNAGWQYHQIHRIEREKVPVYEGQVLDADGEGRDGPDDRRHDPGDRPERGLGDGHHPPERGGAGNCRQEPRTRRPCGGLGDHFVASAAPRASGRRPGESAGPHGLRDRGDLPLRGEGGCRRPRQPALAGRYGGAIRDQTAGGPLRAAVFVRPARGGPPAYQGKVCVLRLDPAEGRGRDLRHPEHGDAKGARVHDRGAGVPGDLGAGDRGGGAAGAVQRGPGTGERRRQPLPGHHDARHQQRQHGGGGLLQPAPAQA
jgi:PAS domain S-box-containing protein